LKQKSRTYLRFILRQLGRLPPLKDPPLSAPPLTKGLAFIGIRFDQILGVFLNPPPPLGKKKFLGLLRSHYIKYILCQYKNEIVKRIF
jgi:hypothetical protein